MSGISLKKELYPLIKQLMGTKILIYSWMVLTVALIAIPSGLVLYRLGKKLFGYLNNKAQLIKENAELKTMKTELEQQKEEFITTGEY